MLGFETIGNATAIFYDKNPILATDPWIDGDAYFGSWGLSHEIPKEQLDAIERCSYIWLSHGHPDHINSDSLEMELFKNKTFLVSDHYGNRISNDLKENGRKVKILKSKKWFSLTPNIEIMTITNIDQDSILLVKIGNDLVCNINDARDTGFSKYVRKITSKFKNSFLLRICGFGDATMINYRSENDDRLIIPQHVTEHMKNGVGKRMQEAARLFGTKFVVPFSSLHRYQRTDSQWANKYVAKLKDYKVGFNDKNIILTEAFIKWDCLTGTLENIRPKEKNNIFIEPEKFGDNWSDTLSKEDKVKITNYLKEKITLNDQIGFVNFKVGGETHSITFNKEEKLGFTFETPRGSLMKIVNYKIFDDLLIGNYAKLTLHNVPYFVRETPLKILRRKILYSDQGGANSSEEINEYLKYYEKLFPLEILKRKLITNTEQIIRKHIKPNTKKYIFLKKLYYFVKRKP